MSTLTRLICTLTIMGSFLTTHAANMNGEKRRNEYQRSKLATPETDINKEKRKKVYRRSNNDFPPKKQYKKRLSMEEKVYNHYTQILNIKNNWDNGNQRVHQAKVIWQDRSKPNNERSQAYAEMISLQTNMLRAQKEIIGKREKLHELEIQWLTNPYL